MRLLNYLKEHTGAVLLVFVLLMAQAACDLMLPNYTSRIVDVGIQQGGITRVAPRELSDSTYKAISAALSGEDALLFASSYEPTANGTYIRAENSAEHAELATDTADALDAVMARPLAAVYGIEIQDDSENIALQAGIAAARLEYTSLGYDTNGMQLSYLALTGAKMLGFAILGSLIAVAVGFVASRTGASIGRSLRSRLFAKVMSFSDAEVQKFSAASLITRGTNDIQQIQMMTVMTMRMILYAPILGVGGIIMMTATDVSMGWIIGLAVIVIVIVMIGLMFLAMPKFKLMQKLVDRVNLVAREMLTGVSVIRAFGQEETEQVRFDEVSTQLMRTQLFVNRVMTFLMPTMFLVMNVVSILIVWVGAQRVDAGVLQTGDLIAFITYSMIVIMGFLMLSMLAVVGPRANVSATRIDEVLETEPSITDGDVISDAANLMVSAGADAHAGTATDARTAAGADAAAPASHIIAAPTAGADAAAPASHVTAAPTAGVRITFNNVSFRYGDQGEYALRDVSFDVDPGSVCALIGSTGSGKSTVLKLLMRFYDVSQGSILVDGHDIRTLKLQDLRLCMGYVPQKSFLFSGTIASNVGYAQEGITDDRIAWALEVAQASDLVASKDEGLQAPITQGGSNVSGGQRQRLAIARALASNARALLFDDSFSALDYATDAALRSALVHEAAGKTQIIVAQRIATVMSADTIIVLDEGRIVGKGTHAQLLKECAQYREIAYSQLSPEELNRQSAVDTVQAQDQGAVEASRASSEEGGDVA